MHPIKILFSVALLLASTGVTRSASSDWYQTEGGRIRLVSTGLPDSDGRLRGALQVDLQPGWKTYWRDPGEAGVPPQVSATPEGGLRNVTLNYPPPQRFHEHGSQWAGYSEAVSFALDLSVDPSLSDKPVAVDVFLGICQTICIPVQTQLSLDINARADDMFDRATVDAAFDSLPEKAGPTLSVTGVEVEGDRLLLSVDAPNGTEPLLFLASDGGYQFGVPRFDPASGRFEAAVLSEPAHGRRVTIHYTLSHADGAAEGSFVFPSRP